MANQIVKLGGWKSRRLDNVTFYRCPGCGDCQDMPFWGSDGLVECFHCHRKFAHEKFTAASRRRTIVECVSCGREVPLISSTFGMAGLGFICSGCSQYVAILYGNQFVQPSLILDVHWNPDIFKRAEFVCPERLCFARCKTIKDYLVVRVLQAIVKEEDMRFMFVSPEDHWAGLLLDSKKQKYLGFLVWTEGEYAVLRQIFIVEDERRKGHAEKLVKFWVQCYADRLNKKFGIESPNEQAMSLHLKLGHIRVEGDRYIGVKCFWVLGL